MTTRASDIARDFELGTINEVPMIASDIIYEGSAVGENSTGYARPFVAGDPFLGFAERNADNSATGSAAGDVNVRLRKEGAVKLSVASAALLDIGKAVYASDDDTFSLLATMEGSQGTKIGFISRYISSGVAVVQFKATGLNDTISASPLVGVARQGIHEVSSTQRYPLGTILKKADGREYVYAKAGATLTPDMGAKSYNTQHVSFAALPASADALATSFSLTVGGTDGVAGNGAIAANELRGGYVVVFPHSANTFVRRIESNTLIAAGGGTIIITVDDPIPVAIELTNDHAEAMASPYLDVRNTTEATSSVVGVPTMVATVGQYLWLQKKGPVWIAPQTDVSVGNNSREVVFRHDGSLDDHTYSDATVAKAQHAGYVLANAAGGGQGAPFVMLDI